MRWRRDPVFIAKLSLDTVPTVCTLSLITSRKSPRTALPFEIFVVRRDLHTSEAGLQLHAAVVSLIYPHKPSFIRERQSTVVCNCKEGTPSALLKLHSLQLRSKLRPSPIFRASIYTLLNSKNFNSIKTETKLRGEKITSKRYNIIRRRRKSK